MEGVFNINRAEVFLPETPVLEIFVGDSVLYLSLFLVLRFVLKRESETVGISDMLIIVLLADASQNAMAGVYRSIMDGLLLVATLIFWASTLNWLG